MKRFLLTGLLFLLLAGVLWARVPSQTEVTEVACHLVARDGFQEMLPGRTVESVSWVALEDAYGVWIVDLAPSGHLALGVSTKYRAMITWSDADFVFPDRASPQYALLLRAAKRSSAAESGDGEEHPSWTIDASELLATSIPTNAITIRHQPVDTAKWSQTGVMAWYVPGSAPCGCVATALAQMMHALQWPVYTEGMLDADLSYNGNTETYAFHPYTRFNYGMMDLSLTDSTTNLSKNQQVARLVLLCDILAKMEFKDGGSGAVSSWAAVTPWVMEPKTFKNTSSYSSTQIATIEQTMADGVPIMAAISNPNHAILASGYARYSSEPYVRLNYGWGGKDSGWYHINDTDELTIAYPKRTVQCDPLPAISSATPTLSWHLPKCYADKVKGFKITATTIPTATSGSTTWTDSFESLSGDTAGNSSAVVVGRRYVSALGGYTRYVGLGLYSSDIEDFGPKALYTWQPTFIPTANSKWKFFYNISYARGPIYLQVLPLGGTWETVKIFDVGSKNEVTWEDCSIDLSDYAGKPVKLRAFLNPVVYENGFSYSYSLPTFAMAKMSVTNLAQVITSPTKTVTVSGGSARSYTFSSGALEAGEKYAFTVTPLFTDSSVSGTPSMPCYTQLADADHPVESFASLTFTSPSTQAISQTKMQIKQNLFRYCSYTATAKSIIRLKTEESIESLELYSSHPDAYPSSAFSVESYGEGYFDIIITGSKIPTSPRVNDRLNLTVVAVSKAGTRTAHDLTLVFTTVTSDAKDEPASAPTLTKVSYTDPDGNVYAIPRSWFAENGWGSNLTTAYYQTQAAKDTDGDGLTNAEEYLVGTDPLAKSSKLTITGITINSDKTVTVTYSPTGNGSVSTFILEGKTNLSDETWEKHLSTDTDHRFFRVRVEPN